MSLDGSGVFAGATGVFFDTNFVDSNTQHFLNKTKQKKNKTHNYTSFMFKKEAA